jgi:tetratricopeptide (TPR) repeat protein
VIARCADRPEPSVRQVAAFALDKLGVRLDTAGDHDAAIATFDLAIYRFSGETDGDIRSAVALATLNRGRAYRCSDRISEAINDHVHVIEAYADEPKAASTVIWAKFDLGLCLTLAGRGDEAVLLFDEVVAVASRNPGATPRLQWARALAGKGLALTVLERRDEALAVFEELVANFAESEAPTEVSMARDKIAILREPAR